MEAGATELDMVVDLGLVRAGEWAAVEADIAAVRGGRAVGGAQGDRGVGRARRRRARGCCRAAEDAGADFVKTSTGFHPAGGATIDAVALMAAAVGGRLGVKASGGIRDAVHALAMVDAGATRLGCSATRAILDGL